ncbi:hypothetical protein GWN26_07270 [Candidatus Saccharibacteria bacterium]|nr:hypothetical protein [Candidatus Saccharibacteria bacterium]NIV03777.1 hypothetical protein [Calditrichia bacterium]NIS38297.1 hypothetical protein [Candidatus Saccharibacteria bacterium]NIV72072.1 hypothetical protein [Calditrichia bacterium]NIV98950.1 hypothetical protein [Candidatus Saccharibacteria bacterium]
MRTSNSVVLIKAVLWDLIGNLVYFPVWWYTRGLKKVGGFLFDFVTGMEMRLAWRVWVANIFKPMYAVADIPGRLISFFMRIFMIITRGFALLFIILISLIAIAAYLLWLPFLVVMVLVQLGTLII